MADEEQEKSMDTTDCRDYFAAVHVLYSRICSTCFYRVSDSGYWWEIMACSSRDDKKKT